MSDSGPRSLLAFWLGGAAAPVPGHGGFRSFTAIWLGGAAAPVDRGGAAPQQSGGAFTRRPDRLQGRRLRLSDLQDHFSAEQEALERAARARTKREREALEDAAQAAARAMRAAVGIDDGIEPDIADVALKLQAAAQAKRATHAIKLAEEAAILAADLERTIRFRKGYDEQDPEEEEEDFIHLVFLYL